MTDTADAAHAQGRLLTRPTPPKTDLLEPGLHPLGLDAPQDGLIYVPDADGPRPLLLALHGATMYAKWMARPLVAAADDAGLVMVIPDSRAPGASWDILANGGYGPDVAFCDAAMAYAFTHCNVDATNVSVGGISDGASYALSLGVMNGDLFGAIIAWSPGFIAPVEMEGKPRVFLSHGTHDQILPIDRCGRPIAKGLHQLGYDVEYIEFDGGHEMPDPIIRASFSWLVDPAGWEGKENN